MSVKFRRLALHVFCFVLILNSLSFAAAQQELVIISPHWEGLRWELEQGFRQAWESANGGTVKIRWFDVGGTSDMVRYIRGAFEKSPNGIGIDIVFGGGIDPYREFEQRNLLVPLSLPTALTSRLPELAIAGELHSSKQNWFSSNINAFGIIYNRVLLSRLALREPVSWRDLADPKAFSWVALTDPRRSGSARQIYEIILQALGWEEGWKVLFQLAANSRGFSAHSSQVPKDVAAGEVAYGVLLDSYAGELMTRLGTERIGYVLPAGQTAYVGDGIAVLRGSAHVELAQAFVAYVLSEPAQRLLIRRRGVSGGPQRYGLGRLPVMIEAYAGSQELLLRRENPFLEKSNFRYDFSKSAPRASLLNDLIGACLIAPHASLVAARKRDLQQHTNTIASLRVPISEEEALTLAKSSAWAGDARLRAQTLARWEAGVRRILEREGEDKSGLLLMSLPAVGLLLAWSYLVIRGIIRVRNSN